MTALTHEGFATWRRATVAPARRMTRKPQPPSSLRTPFGTKTHSMNPLQDATRSIRIEKKGAQTLKDKESSFEILSVQGNRGIARWQSSFTVIESGKRIAPDCLFVVEFNDEGLCQTFREWWHIRFLRDSSVVVAIALPAMTARNL